MCDNGIVCFVYCACMFVCLSVRWITTWYLASWKRSARTCQSRSRKSRTTSFAFFSVSTLLCLPSLFHLFSFHQHQKCYGYRFNSILYGWLGSRVVSVLDSGAEGPGFKSQSRRCRVTVLGKLFTLIVPLFTKQQNKLVAVLLRVVGVTAGLAKSNGSSPSSLWFTSPACWLPRTGISSGTQCLVIEYGLPLASCQ